jgi:5-methylcytosine-specific restriction protein A
MDNLDRSSPRCSLHPLTNTGPKRILRHQYVDGKHIYSTYKWKKVRKAYSDEHPLCEDCLVFDILTPMAVVDHKVEIEDGGDLYNPDNFRSLCHGCHNRKTAKSKKKRNKSGMSINDF